jgi:brefeldin A-resistance guanine nucleotide exchange factor 1
VSENLKNMLLVLANGGYLAPPEEQPRREDMWTETWKKINRFQPELFGEIFPEEVGKVVAKGKENEKEKAKEEESEKVGEEHVDVGDEVEEEG